jgi:hypothetical protein
MDREVQSPTERIKSLIPSLPAKDISLAYKFLEKRDIESLKDLVSSALYKSSKELKKENPREEYRNVDLGSLNKLIFEVNTYYINIVGQEDRYEYEDYGFYSEFNEEYFDDC